MEIFKRIAGVLSGTCSSQEKEELEVWRKEVPANEEEFCKFKKVWDAASPLSRFRPDTEKAWNKVNACILQQKSISAEKTQKSVVPFYRSPLAIAAAVGLFVVAAGLLLMNRPGILSSEDQKLAVTETKAGEKNTLTLADGSRIWLNEKSKFLYPASFDGHSRVVKLEGEAFFEVAEQPDKPFVVLAGAGKIKVLGTSFNIDTKEQLIVQVSSGTVSFSATESEKSLTLMAGDAAVLKGNTPEMVKQDPNFLSWKTGEFVFEDSPVKEVFRSLEEYYGVELSAASAEILNCRLFARFQEQPLEEVLKVLSLTLNLKYEYQPGQAEVVFSHQAQAQSCSPAVP